MSSKKDIMQKLTNKEEEVMHIIWKLNKAFVRDIMEEMKDDKPHYNTLSTTVRKLEEKGYVGYTAYGKTHQYYPIIEKDEYRKGYISKTIDNYFSNSYKNLVSFFAKEDKISLEELRDIIKEIEKNK